MQFLTSLSLAQLKDFSGCEGCGIDFFFRLGPPVLKVAVEGGGTPMLKKGGAPGGGGGPPGGGGGAGGGGQLEKGRGGGSGGKFSDM